MVQTTPRQLDLQHTATIRALSSLTKRDSAAVRATVRATGNLFAVQEHDDYDGYLSLLLTPQHAGAAGFLVSGRTSAVDLAELHGDDMVPLGRFPSIGAAMLTLRPTLERGIGTSTAGLQAQRMFNQHGPDADIHAAMRADSDDGASGDGDRWRAVVRAIDQRHDIS